MASVLVTGGTGFFGHNLVAALVEDDRVAWVHVYARHPPPTEYKLSNYRPDGSPEGGGGKDLEPCPIFERVLQNDGPNAVFAHAKVIFHKGSITDRVELESVMEECSMVFHACGDTRWWNAVEDEQYETNVTGTMTALELAVENPTITRFIYTSTVDVMGSVGGGRLTEGEQGDPFDYHYAVTKTEAEAFVLRHAKHKHDRLRITVIRPGSMVGPWDVTNQYGRLFKELKHRSLLGVPCGGTSVCHVADVARAHVAAAFAPSLEHTVYVCAGANMLYQQMFRDMRAQLHGQDEFLYKAAIGPCCMPCEVMPEAVLVLYGWCCEQYSNWVSGKEPEVNPGMARYLSQYAYYTSGRAQDELGYPTQSAIRWEEACKEALAWYTRRGRL
jgi:dihydroflavonol-4-reductase